MRTERPPIVELAESFKGEGAVHNATILLMRTWGESDPPSGVSQHPASYVATFVDMARALDAAGLLAPAPLREEWGVTYERRSMSNDEWEPAEVWGLEEKLARQSAAEPDGDHMRRYQLVQRLVTDAVDRAEGDGRAEQ